MSAPRPASRRSARRDAVVLLYQRDLTGIALDELSRTASRDRGRDEDPYTSSIVDGVTASLGAIDALITGAAEGWTSDRLGAIERSILRVAVWEACLGGDVPVGVAVNEAVELAKRYCDPAAPAFVNGILGRITADHAEAASA